MKTLFAFERDGYWYLTPQPADMPCRGGKVFDTRGNLLMSPGAARTDIGW
jgi:hypothetical protein